MQQGPPTRSLHLHRGQVTQKIRLCSEFMCGLRSGQVVVSILGDKAIRAVKAKVYDVVFPNNMPFRGVAGDCGNGVPILGVHSVDRMFNVLGFKQRNHLRWAGIEGYALSNLRVRKLRRVCCRFAACNQQEPNDQCKRVLHAMSSSLSG